MNNNTKFQWIDNDTDVSEILKKCPKGLLKTIEEMEQADLAGDFFLFDNVSDSFDVSTKIMLQNGVITEEFGKEFTRQLFTVFGKDADDITSAWFEQIGMYCEGTRGWCTALEKAADIIGCRELFEYYKALPWYDSDEFDGQLYTIIKGYHLFD